MILGEPSAGRSRACHAGRILCVTFLAAVFVLIDFGRIAPGGGQAVLAFLAVVAVASLAAYHLDPSFRLVTWLQAGADIALVTALVAIAGGIESDFSFAYFAVIIASSILVSPRAALLCASLATVCLAGVALAPLLGAAREGLDAGSNAAPARLFILESGVAYHLVGLLAGMLSSGVVRIQAFSRQVLADIDEAVIAVDNTGRIIFLNHKAEEILRIVQDEATGRMVGDVLAGKAPPFVSRTLAGGDVVKREVLLAEGGVPHSFRTSRITDSHGRMRGTIGVLLDLTVYHRMTKAVKEAERMRLVGEMGAGIAHEIRNPMASIRASAQELKLSEDLSGDSRTLFEIIVRESDRLNRIITDFLSYARIQSSRKTHVALAPLLDDVVTMLTRNEAGEEVAIRRVYGRELTCWGDVDRLKQVFLNIGLNAVQASSPDGTITFRGWVEHFGESRWTVVEIMDEGPGIPAVTVDRIFEPFYSGRPGGTGMGLAVAQQIVKEHDGEIVVQTGPEGSVFTVRLLPRLEAAGSGQEEDG